MKFLRKKVYSFVQMGMKKFIYLFKNSQNIKQKILNYIFIDHFLEQSQWRQFLLD